MVIKLPVRIPSGNFTRYIFSFCILTGCSQIILKRGRLARIQTDSKSIHTYKNYILKLLKLNFSLDLQLYYTLITWFYFPWSSLMFSWKFFHWQKFDSIIFCCDNNFSEIFGNRYDTYFIGRLRVFLVIPIQ